MNKKAKIYIAGHRGLVGSSILRNLQENGFINLVYKTRQELNLLNQSKVSQFFKKESPEYVFLAAAKVGGILTNMQKKADFIYENLEIQNNVIYNSWKYKVKKLLFLGSSCIYPKLCCQPIREEYLLTGELEKTNDAYAVAKIAGIKMCQSFNEQYGTNFISVMPANLYGPNDNFDLNTSHVLPALIRKFHEAKISGKNQVEVWGTGSAKREFLHVDDLASACVFLMKTYNINEIVNIGTGSDLSIKELVEIIKKTVGFEGEVRWNKSKPDGTPRKLLDVRKLKKLGWENNIDINEGIAATYKWFRENF